jgi:hypothetical protein
LFCRSKPTHVPLFFPTMMPALGVAMMVWFEG